VVKNNEFVGFIDGQFMAKAWNVLSGTDNKLYIKPGTI
jgi:hypothetical protein